MKTATAEKSFEVWDELIGKSGYRELVVITNHPKGIKQHYLGKDLSVYVVCTRLQLLFKRKTFLNLPEQNVKLISLHHINEEFVKNKFFVCSDYLGTRPVLALFHFKLRRFLRVADLSVIQVAKTWFWDVKTLRIFAAPNRTVLVGTMPEDNSELVAISGRLTDVRGATYPSLPVLAIITQFNEGDIIEPVVNHLLAQGVDVHIIDNWSTDGSYESVAALAAQSPNSITYERFPAKDSHKYEWTRLLERVTEVAKENLPRYRWIISNDADEVRWSPWEKIDLQTAISFIDHLGYNCVDYTVFNFQATSDGYKRGDDPLIFFNYGEFGAENWYFIQLKTWRNHPEAEIASSGGHVVNFPNRKIFPLKFLLGHYPLRSSAQAKQKIFKDRRPRFATAEVKKGWHVQYKGITSGERFIHPTKGLINFDDPSFRFGYLLQTVLGLGIKRK